VCVHDVPKDSNHEAEQLLAKRARRNLPLRMPTRKQEHEDANVVEQVDEGHQLQDRVAQARRVVVLRRDKHRVVGQEYGGRPKIDGCLVIRDLGQAMARGRAEDDGDQCASGEPQD
jgi:hypothetical protein